MLSAIITSFKEPKTIGKAIEQIEKQILKEDEILVIALDNETLEEAKKYAIKDRRIKLLRDKGEGKPAALNLAVSKAKGDILVLTDGDVYVGENSIKFLLEPFEYEKVGAVCGN